MDLSTQVFEYEVPVSELTLQLLILLIPLFKVAILYKMGNHKILDHQIFNSLSRTKWHKNHCENTNFHVYLCIKSS